MSTSLFGIVTAALMAALAALAMGAGHYWAPRASGDELGRIAAYTYGCLLGILLPFGLWFGLWFSFVGQPVAAWVPPVLLLVVMCGAGAGTVLSYALDHLHGMRMRAREQNQRHRDG